MKFRYKVVLVNIIIIALTLSISGFFIMSRQNQLMIDSQIKNAVTENNLIESAVEYSLLDIINDPTTSSVQGTLPIVSQRISSGMLSSTANMFVTYNHDIVFSSSKDTSNETITHIKDLVDDSSSRKKYLITDETITQTILKESKNIDNNDNATSTKYETKKIKKNYIYVASSIVINDTKINIITKRDNTETIDTINNNIYIFRIFIISMLLLSGIIVYGFSKLLTKPLEKLNSVTDEFAEGNFESRSTIHSQDEVGLLSKKFNHMADSVNNHIDELNDMIHRRDQFVADFTHEIKTPMTTIIGYADTIRSVELPREDEVKAANYIFSEGKRLEQMSSHLFDLIYLKDGVVPKQPINTQGLGEAVVTTVEPAIERAQLTLKADFENANITGDSALLKSVFINLLDNARKASTVPDNKREIIFSGRIISGEELSSRQKDEDQNSKDKKKSSKDEFYYEYVVEDHGIGIAEEDINKICDEFYMVDKSRSRSEGGAGLGMSLVAAILKEHDAELNIESELGVGTKMIVTMPCEKSEE